MNAVTDFGVLLLLGAVPGFCAGFLVCLFIRLKERS